MSVATASAAACVLGEGAVWDHRIGRLHYVDILAPAVITLDPETGITTRRPMPQMIGFVALTPDPRRVVGGLRGGLYDINLETGRISLLCPVEADMPAMRINDGTVAPDGAIVFGTMETVERRPIGAFWRWHKGALTKLGGAMVVTNGPAFSADGRVVLTVDSVGRKIFRHTYTNGGFTDPQLFATIPGDAGVPDGLSFDSNGDVWVCHFGGSRVTRFDPNGNVVSVIALPASQITKCCFGGRAFNRLYITSAARACSLKTEPEAGRLFSVDVDVAGFPATIADL